VHTSTVTVAVVDASSSDFTIADRDLEVQWYSGSGSGGQNRNKTQNCCRLIHRPTGIVRTAQMRDRSSSYTAALKALMGDLKSAHEGARAQSTNDARRDQIGSGMRGDKVRTYQFQRDSVGDHRSGKVARCRDVMRGNFDLLWS